MYAGRKRRKPVQRAAKPPPTDGAKSNPSKRHRDRLNGELERLAGLLPFPQDVTSSLDKLSILRLSVSFLRAKNFFSVALNYGDRAADSKIPEGELLLQALNGFVIVLTANGTIFYSSHSIQDYLGFNQTDVLHQSIYELVHTEDQQELSRNLHWALNPPQTTSRPPDSPHDTVADSSSSLMTFDPEQLPPENSSFLERSFMCRFRCLLDNSSGFLALNIHGRLKFLHGQNHHQDNGGKVPSQLALFAIATPLQPPSILEIRTKNMIFRTKHKLDFTPLACDAKGKIVLGYTEAELRVRGSGYQFIHAADMLYCAENHVRMMKTGESGLTVFRLLTKENRWKWVQANARLVYKNGKPDYIIATQRPLLDEEGGEHLRKRSMHLPFTYATGEALLYQSNHPIAVFSDRGHEKNDSRSKKSLSERLERAGLDPGSLLGALMSQDESVYVSQPAMEPKVSLHSGFFGEQMQFPNPVEADSRRSWAEPADQVPEPGSSFDPLLATLDSLSLEGQDVGSVEDSGCSNGELFRALEGLGLSAEDLELLLLDERMIRVEMDPERVPTLDDLLTNDEILSYIYDSIDGGAEAPDPRGAAVPSSTSTSTASIPNGVNVQMFAPCKQTPIIQLSQQMQQHLSMQTGPAASDCCQQQDHNGDGLTQSAPNRQWTAQDILSSAGSHLDHLITEQTTFSSETSGQQMLSVQNQLPQQGRAKQNGLSSVAGSAQPAGTFQWQDFDFITSPGSGLDNGPKPHTDPSLEFCMDYSLPPVDNVDYTSGDGGLFGRPGQQQVSSYQGMNQKLSQDQIPVPIAQVLSSFSQCPPPSTSLEQIIGVSKPCRQMDLCCMINQDLPLEPNHRKTNTYPGGCPLPNGSGVAFPVVQTSDPEALPSLPDPPATGFYL
ncbi:aryl hydrocarbon receptor-like isoform X1 [Gouania willdenowi]|uniref:aryl hydrocarbon receptor-like isoform X1 n=1 Tax=Gouania willdenowi TaxID=441366 RepID=UPI0010569489|nr:aryl hydrocarbon receptor-like isoform X1 [Gouania willdenowi]